MFLDRSGNAFISLCVVLSFLTSFVGTFVYFVYLYAIYALELSLLFGREFFDSGRSSHLDAKAELMLDRLKVWSLH